MRSIYEFLPRHRECLHTFCLKATPSQVGLCFFLNPWVMENTGRYEYRDISFNIKFTMLLSEPFYAFLSGWWVLSCQYYRITVLIPSVLPLRQLMHWLLSVTDPQLLMPETKPIMMLKVVCCYPERPWWAQGGPLQTSWSSVQGWVQGPAPALR